MKALKGLIACVLLFGFASCGGLQPVQVSVQPNFYKYRYVYVMPTGSVTASSGVYSTSSGYVSGGVTRSVNPTDIITGYLMRKGMNILPALDQNKLSETMVVSYGEAGRRNMGFLFLDVATGIVIQFRDAATNDLVASAQAEDSGYTEADNVRYAIERALDAIFSSPRY